jgi:hypothetical protein
MRDRGAGYGTAGATFSGHLRVFLEAKLPLQRLNRKNTRARFEANNPIMMVFGDIDGQDL